MVPPNPGVFRSRTLTNSAAEFVESRADIKSLAQADISTGQLEDLRRSEFVPEFDRFVLKGNVFDPSKQYEESQKRMSAFRRSLEHFASLLKERNVDSQLNIVIRDPSQFTLQYSLDIIKKIGESHDNSDKTKSCKDFIIGCYEKIETNRNVIDAFLSLIPNDIYGSVISGGFTLIMAAVEKHFENRKAIQNFLAEIPKKLESIQRLAGIHRYSIRLHRCADAVMVAIFTVLERIVDEITRTWKSKWDEKTDKLAKGIGYLYRRIKKKNNKSEISHAVEFIANEEDSEDDNRKKKLTVTDALADLEGEVDRFQKEVDICGQERLGRVEMSTYEINRNMKNLQDQRASADSLRAHIKTLEAKIDNTLYVFQTSNPNFNDKTGGVNHEEVEFQREQEAISSRSRLETNVHTASKWLQGLKRLPYDPEVDIKDCLDHMELLDPDEKNVSHSILHSKQVAEWLKEGKSNILDVGIQTAPDSLNNALSFTSALFTMTLLRTKAFPVLAFFCMHRNNESSSEDRSGPLALVNSLNGQLVSFISDRRHSVDLLALKEGGYFSGAKKNVKDGLQLLNALLSSLPKGDMVFVIIDSFSRLSGSFKGAEMVIKKLNRAIGRREDISIKVMVTDALSSSCVKDVAGISLYTPDLVSGFDGIDVDESRDRIRQGLEGGDEDTTTEDDDDDDDDDDE